MYTVNIAVEGTYDTTYESRMLEIIEFWNSK